MSELASSSGIFDLSERHWLKLNATFKSSTIICKQKTVVWDLDGRKDHGVLAENWVW